MATSVASFAELKSAIEDTTTTEILVTEDITFASGGAKVNVNKSTLVIDFNGHKVTDNNSASFTDTIYIASTTNTLSVTAKNAIWSGRNYYGVIGVYNGDTNVTINLVNIDYTGPQFVYNKNGTTNITDCTVLLAQNDSSTSPQEFCEANRLNIFGSVYVTSNSTSDAVIWFTGTNASLTVNENAIFNVNAPLTYLLYTDVSPIMLFKQNSKTTISTRSGLFYASGSGAHIAQSFTLEESASFIAYKNISNTVPMFKCLSNFTLNNNSTFQLYSEIISSAPLMYFGQRANINITTPKNVVLYNRGGDAFSFATGTSANPNLINITTEMLRLWNIAKSPSSSAGDLDDPPTTEFHKAEYSTNLNLSVKATSSQLSSVESNIEADDVGYPLSTTTLKLITSKVISMGTLPLTLDEITDLSTQITGTTDALANVKVEYEQTSSTLTADDKGGFTLDLTDKMPVDTVIKITVNKLFLTKNLSVMSVGSVSISNIDSLRFQAFTSPSNLSVVFRENADFGLTITDTRTSGGEWFLYAYIENPLTSGEDILENVLVFSQNGNTTTLNSTPLLVYTGQWNENEKTTSVSWATIEGFLLNIEPKKEYKAGNYTTNLLWQVSTTKL